MEITAITEGLRLPSPAPEPQSLGFDGTTLWMGSRATRRLYAIDSVHWTARDEGDAPGTPWGLAVAGDELFVVCGEGADDHRRIRRFIPGHGFKTHGAIECPDDTGSQLAFDGEHLHLVQWYRKRVLELDAAGAVVGTLEAPREICGLAIVAGAFFVVTVEDEHSDEYFLTKLVRSNGAAQAIDLARIPFKARSLAFDGSRFWTNHRERSEIVAFAAPLGAF